MNDLISPKYQMRLISSIEKAIWQEYKSYKQVRLYIDKWHEDNYDPNGFNNNYWENFSIVDKAPNEIDLTSTLHNINGIDLIKIAIDLGVDTPDFIPSIPTFKNELKTTYKTAHDTFVKAFRQIESDPGLAIGLANSALESIIKTIIKDERIAFKINGGETLYRLTSIILREFKLSSTDHPKEIKTISNSLLQVNQAIETLRSEKTSFHGKTEDDAVINDSLYSYFIINTICTIGTFLNSYYKLKFPTKAATLLSEEEDELPF